MKKIPITLVISLLLLGAGCAVFTGPPRGAFGSETTVEEQLATLFDEYERYDGSVCMGISGPHGSKSRAVRVATERCLQMLAFHYGLAMQTEAALVVQTARNRELFDSMVFGGTSDGLYERTAREMEIVDVQWYGGKIGAVVFARLPQMVRIAWDKENNWLERTPTIPGFTVVTAQASRSYDDLAQAIEAATFRSAQAMLDIAPANVQVTHGIQEVSTDHYTQDLYAISGIRMDGFVVLSYRYDRGSGRVHALAVAKGER